MSITCTTQNGGVNLNDGTNYFLSGFDWQNTRKQTWVEPVGGRAILASDTYGLMTITIQLRVAASSQTVLVTKMENIRNEFGIVDNVINWAIGGGAGVTKFITRPSNIDPPSYTNSGSDVRLAMMASQFSIPLWIFDVLADPLRNNETRPPVI